MLSATTRALQGISLPDRDDECDNIVWEVSGYSVINEFGFDFYWPEHVHIEVLSLAKVVGC